MSQTKPEPGQYFTARFLSMEVAHRFMALSADRVTDKYGSVFSFFDIDWSTASNPIPALVDMVPGTTFSAHMISRKSPHNLYARKADLRRFTALIPEKGGQSFWTDDVYCEIEDIDEFTITDVMPPHPEPTPDRGDSLVFTREVLLELVHTGTITAEQLTQLVAVAEERAS
jgi:hypothetical protein